MRAVEQSVRLERISQERFIQAPIDAVYDYVTQPDRWHEWHPTSLGADTGTTGPLPAGARFTEMIDLLGVRVPMSYRVQIARRPDEFKRCSPHWPSTARSTTFCRPFATAPCSSAC